MHQPPIARRDPVIREHHGDQFADPYAWMADRRSQEFLDLLNAENAYAERLTEPVADLAEDIFAEMKGRIVETDLSVPVRHDRWWYYTRTIEGEQYPVEARVLVSDSPDRPRLDGDAAPAGEQILLDHNLEAGDHEFFSVGPSEITADGQVLAFGVDVTGDERYDVTVRRISDGEVLDTAVRGTGGSLAWSLDGSHFFYTRVDDAWRPHQVWRHRVGSPADEDVLVHEEPDERFFVGVGTSRDDRTIIVAIGSKVTTEFRLLDAADHLGVPRIVTPRRQGLEYDVEVAGDRLFIVHNARRENFEVAVAPHDATSEADWHPLEITGPDEYVTGIEAFERHLVISLRREGQTAVRVVARDDDAPNGLGVSHDIALAEPIHTIAVGSNPESSTTSLQLSVVSLVTPTTVYDYDLDTREFTELKRQQVRGGHDPDDYVQRMEWASADDGTQVPISIVHHKDTPLDGTAPGFLYAYGAYGVPLDPYFSVLRLSLLQRGWVHATAHVRGGSEMGRHWYEQGKLEHKPNSFSDFVAAADHFRSSGMIDPNLLAAEGGSAGGLLAGAVANQAPDRFAFVHAAVPFVDPLTTILDPSMPLTVLEWEEWGNPLEDPAAYALMKSYSPYENVTAQRYPTILATSSLNDTRVYATEPAKWVAALRHDAAPDSGPVIFRTEMAAGHGGQSGRYRLWRQAAWETAVMIGAVTGGLAAT